MMRLSFVLIVAIAIAVPIGVRAHEGEGGEPGHFDMMDGVNAWHEHPTAEELEAEREAYRAHRQKRCEAKQAEMQRKADDWNRREAIAYQKLQEACADQSAVGQNSCEYRRRMYQANYSPAESAEFGEWLRGEIAKACEPPKSAKELECENLARVIEGARSRRNDKGIDYWTQRATEAGCI